MPKLIPVTATLVLALALPVRYRQLAGDTTTAVAYCPMAKKPWLQKEGEAIGNPYYGQKMPGCGSFVAN